MKPTFAFHVVLVEPEIPQNTGSIGRLCLATGTHLHLIKPLGFEISDSQLKRAGLDYWEHLRFTVHESLEEMLQAIPPEATKVFLTKKSGRDIYECRIPPNAYFFFGKETAGLPESVLAAHPLDTFKIPMFDARVRSLNLATAVGIALYEGIRQNHY